MQHRGYDEHTKCDHLGDPRLAKYVRDPHHRVYMLSSEPLCNKKSKVCVSQACGLLDSLKF